MRKSVKEGVVEIAESLRTRTAELTSEEEKVLRMRNGVRARPDLVLDRVGQDNPDVGAELLLIEMNLFRQMRERMSPKAVPISSRTKDKIVRALRRR